jgi:hypothetical protein
MPRIIRRPKKVCTINRSGKKKCFTIQARRRMNPDEEKEKTDDLMIYFDSKGKWIVEKYDKEKKWRYYDMDVLSIFRSDIPALIKALEKEKI